MEVRGLRRTLTSDHMVRLTKNRVYILTFHAAIIVQVLTINISRCNYSTGAYNKYLTTAIIVQVLTINISPLQL